MSKRNKTIVLVLLMMLVICLLIASAIRIAMNTSSKLDFLLIAIIFIGISGFCKIYK